MKLRYFLIVGIACLALGIVTTTSGQFLGAGNSTINTVDKWRYTGGYALLSSSTAKLMVPGLASSDECLKTDASGKTYTGACGTGGISGGTANLLTYWVSGSEVSATSSPTVGYVTATSTTASRLPFASSTGISATTFWGTLIGNASTTHLSISGNSYLGTVRSGTWNGTSLEDAYVDDNITASSYLSLASWFATTTIPHLVSFGSSTATTTALGNLTITGNAFKGSVPLLASGGTLTTNYVCRWDGTGIDCDRVEDASGACGANAVCMGGHTHVGVNETYGSGWNGDTDTPEKDDVYDYAHLFDTDDDGKVDVLDMTYGVVGVSSTGVVSATTSPSFVTITATSTTASSSFQAITGTAFGIVGKWFASATQFIVSVVADFTAGVIAQVRLNIPNGASVYTNNTGDIAIDTTSGQFRWGNGSGTSTTVGFYTTGFSWASSTAITGTTTVYLAPAASSLTVSLARCEVPTGTLNVQLHDGTNRSNLFNASSTIGTVNLTTNNTFTAGESMRVDFGTASSSPTTIACRFTYAYNAD